MSSSFDDALVRRAMSRLGTSLCGRYALLHLVGMGGMAAVYAGVHRNGHGVAIKILHEGLASDPEIKRLFRREALLANKIGHPGVVAVLDDDFTEDGAVFLVMPLLEGETLRARVERFGRKLPLGEVLLIAHAVLGVLIAAHAKKIVHRDIKPENIFLTRAGEVRVLDFGIGRFFETSQHATVTRSGHAVGTPAFMAPEQALGRLREVDGRTDLWALGATMFSLLSGRFVHEAESATEIAVLAATRPARALGVVAPDVPAAVTEVVDRALSFKKEERWCSAQEMDRALLEACEAALGTTIPELPRITAPSQGPIDDIDALPTSSLRALAPTVFDEKPAPSSPSPAEPFREAATRTSTAAILAPGGPPHPGRTRSRPFARFVLVGGAVIMIALGLQRGLQKWRRSPAAAPPVLRATTSDITEVLAPHGSPQALIDDRVKLSPPPADLAALPAVVPENAKAEYLAGLQLWRDASSFDSIARFEAATALASDFAAAHLWYVLASNYVSPRVREHFAAARLYRGALTEEQAEVLSALAPSMGDPSDLSSTTQLLHPLISTHPADIYLPLLFAAEHLRLGESAAGLAALDDPHLGSSPPAFASYIRARLLSFSHDANEIREALNACVARSPDGADCLYDLWLLDTNEGRCEDLEPICRHLVAAQPTSTFGFECLADAFFSTGSPLDVVRSVYDEQLRHAPAGAASRRRPENPVTLAIADGRLADADALAKAWQESITADYKNDPNARTHPYEVRVELNVELQRKDVAGRLAREFSNASKAWTRSDFTDVAASSIYLNSLAGALSVDDRARLRNSVVQASLAPSYGSPPRRWYNAHALSTWTADEAAAALSHLPTNGLFPPDTRTATDDYLYGRVFSLAGQTSTAVRFFSRAAHSCSLRHDIARTQAKIQLARLSEDRSDIACGLYREVARHWRHSPEAASVSVANSRMLALHCSSSEPH